MEVRRLGFGSAPRAAVDLRRLPAKGKRAAVQVRRLPAKGREMRRLPAKGSCRRKWGDCRRSRRC
jgi:hypothetical protein